MVPKASRGEAGGRRLKRGSHRVVPHKSRSECGPGSQQQKLTRSRRGDHVCHPLPFVWIASPQRRTRYATDSREVRLRCAHRSCAAHARRGGERSAAARWVKEATKSIHTCALTVDVEEPS